MSAGPTQCFEQVGVWHKVHTWVLSMYRMTERFPKHETYGISSQLRRAAVSVPANFAEGYKKRGRADKAWFMNIAQGSVEECRYYLILRRDLGSAETRQALEDLDEVSRMLDAYHRRLLSPVS